MEQVPAVVGVQKPGKAPTGHAREPYNNHNGDDYGDDYGITIFS